MSADLLRRMIEAGCPADIIADVATALAEGGAAQRVLEGRRAKDRVRKTPVPRNSTEAEESAEFHSDPAPSLEVSPQTPLPNPTPTPGVTTRARKGEPFPRPEWADPEVWSDLLTNRRKKNLPNTASAHRKLLADVDRLVDDNWPPGRVLEAAVSRGWGAIYAGCKDDDDGRRNGNSGGGGGQRLGGHQPGDGLSATTRAAITVFGAPSASH